MCPRERERAKPINLLNIYRHPDPRREKTPYSECNCQTTAITAAKAAAVSAAVFSYWVANQQVWNATFQFGTAVTYAAVVAMYPQRFAQLLPLPINSQRFGSGFRTEDTASITTPSYAARMATV